MCFSSGSKEHIGKVAFIDKNTNYIAGGFMGIIRAKKINEKYLYFLLNYTYRESVKNLSNGNNINNLSSLLNNLKIPLPPKDIQEKIINEIETLEILEKESREKIENYNQNINLIINSLEKNEKVFISEISENLDNKRKPVTAGNRTNGIYPYYGASGIVDYVDDYLLDDVVLLISEDGANLKSRVTPIAFTASGKIWVNNHAHILKFNNICTHKLVELYLNRMDLSPYITGQAQPKLNQKNLNQIQIPLPSLQEQQQIVKQIEEIEYKIQTIENELKTLPIKKEEILKKYL